MADAYTLVIETSTPFASVARVASDGTLEQREFRSDRNHNALLFGPLDELLDGVRGNIGLVLVGSGPGSYSGTRVGIAAAQGIAIASRCPVVALPSVLAVPSACEGAACLAIGDARRGSYWTARSEGFAMAEDPVLCDASGLAAAVGAAVAAGAAVISFEPPDRYPAGLPPVREEFPDAAGLWRAWLRTDSEGRGAHAARPPQPLYLKPPHITPAKRPWWTPARKEPV